MGLPLATKEGESRLRNYEMTMDLTQHPMERLCSLYNAPIRDLSMSMRNAELSMNTIGRLDKTIISDMLDGLDLGIRLLDLHSCLGEVVEQGRWSS